MKRKRRYVGLLLIASFLEKHGFGELCWREYKPGSGISMYVEAALPFF